MKMIVKLLFFLGLCAYTLGGACLTDYDTSHAASAYNTRLYSYTSSNIASKSTSSSLTFMSYNLQSSISSSCVSNPTTQAGLMLSYDYVGNQEVVQGVDTRCNCNMPQIIANTGRKDTRFLMTIPFRTGQYGINAGTSQTILDTKYSLLSYSGVEQRGLVAIKTQPAALNGRYLWFVNTHVEYYVWAARQSQVSQIVSWVRTNIISQDANAVVVLTGDFNSGPGDQAYTTLSALFKNSWQVYTGSSANGYTYPASSPSNRFDHIWFYAPSSVSVSVTNVQIVNTLASDHRPLTATLKFTTSGSSSNPTVAPTVAPTKAATSKPTSAATSKPTSAATSAPSSSGSCSASVSLVKSSSTSVVITNTGTKAIKSITIGFSSAIPSNNWNWVTTSTANHYSIPSWAYQSLAAYGRYYSSSGFYTTGTAPTPSVVSVSC